MSARKDFARGLLALNPDTNWRAATIFDIADAAGVEVAELAPLTLADAGEVLDEVFDAEAARGLSEVDEASSLRDRLFDLAMRRFEAMEPHRAILTAIEGKAGIAQAAAFARAGRTARWLLTLGGVPSEGVDGAARVQGLALVLTRAKAAWLRDQDKDFVRTMAALDQGLRQAEEWAGRLGIAPGGAKAKKDAPEADG